MRNVSVLTALLASLALGGPAVAQTPPPPPPAHHGILGHLFHRPGQPAVPPHGMSRPGQPMMPGHGFYRPGAPSMAGHGMMPMSGGIIGNKNSHVYHLPGDKGSLPSPQNRVYFRTEAQAMAAGYHKAGGGTTSHFKHH